MEILDKQAFEKAIKTDKLALIDFFASWCMPCKMLSPILESLQSKYEGKINFAKLDIDKEEDIAREYDIYSVPTLLLFKKGEKVGMSIGYKSADELIEFLDSYLD